MKRIARASLAGLWLVTVCLATTGALYEMIGRWRYAQRFPQRGHLVQAAGETPLTPHKGGRPRKQSLDFAITE